MQAEWGKGKKREKKEGKQGRERLCKQSGLLLITFWIMDFGKAKTEDFERKKAQAVNLGLELNS
jgi:hypothetical protein